MHDDFQTQRMLEKNRIRRRGIYILPNLFTTAALFAGFFAIVQAMNLNFDQAAAAIFVAMVLDGLDGRALEWIDGERKRCGEEVGARGGGSFAHPPESTYGWW